MSDPNFDPYHKWLGIPPEDQPANHYRLLGLDLFESDRDVIDSASLEQIAYIRTFALGPQSEQSQSLLNELAAARVTLLNAKSKEVYDLQLRFKQAETESESSLPPLTRIARLKAIDGATDALLDQDYARAVAIIDELGPESIDGELEQLRATAESFAQEVDHLRKTILQAVTGGRYDDLLQVVQQYLLLKSEDAEALQLQDQLVAREEEEQAAPPSGHSLDQGSAAVAETRQQQGNARAVEQSEEIDPGLAAKQRNRRLYIRLGAGVALVYVIMLSVMLYLRAQGIAEDVSEALRRGDYTAALELDPGNGQAQLMKQNAEDLGDALKQRDYKTALHIDPSNAEALAMKRSADIQQALADGDYASALTLDPSNAVALAMKRSADIQQALADGDYSRALELEPSNADALAMKKLVMKRLADIQQALADGDYTAALQLEPSNADALAMKSADVQRAFADGESGNSIGMKFKLIPAGKVTMGEDDEAHEVTLTQPFMLGTYEVTQAQYQQVMGTNPSTYKGASNPVEEVSWDDAVEFCKRLSALPAERAAGRVYQLPTEAQWEYACRAGTTTNYSFGDDDSDLGDYAWFREKSSNRTHPVGGKQPNAWGLYDMHGNVWEWCQDWYGAYPDRAVTDPTGAVTGSYRVSRGGCWYDSAELCRSAYRGRDLPSFRHFSIGFRVSLSPSGNQPGADADLAAASMDAERPDDTDPFTVPPAATTPANAPFDTAKAKEHQEAWAKHLGVSVESGNSIGMKFKLIPAGKFTMGENDKAHEVTLTKPFMLGTYEVTQAQYQQVMGTNPSKFKGASNPVEMVTWDDAVEFCKRLSALPAERAAGRVYQLPTEAQWEYACRAGTTTKYSFGENESDLGDYAWFAENSSRTTHPVGGKQPNAWGLYDMHGNVWEWCQDWYEDYPDRAVTDPTGAGTGSRRGRRGGGLGVLAKVWRSAYRGRNSPAYRCNYIGFRVSLSSSGKVAASPPPPVEPGIPTQIELPESGNSIGMKFKLIPAGKFTMGSSDGSDREKPAHQVTLTKPFMLGTHEVTQAQYQQVMGTNPSNFKGASNPVETVNWDDAVEFCKRLSALPAERAAGRVYRLPTEAQWEYACRAGTTTKYIFGDDESDLDDYAWFRENSNRTTHPVGGKQPNTWGLYDMHGNVWEWCQDWYGDYPDRAVTDPTGAVTGSFRVFRGGSWSNPAGVCRSAYRSGSIPSFRFSNYGFRVSLSPSGQ